MFAFFRNQKVRKFFATFYPGHEEFNLFKVAFWLFIAYCILFHILIIRAAIVCAIRGSGSEPIWP